MLPRCLNSYNTEGKEINPIDQTLWHIPQDVNTSLYSVLTLRSSSQYFNTGNKNLPWQHGAKGGYQTHTPESRTSERGSGDRTGSRSGNFIYSQTRCPVGKRTGGCVRHVVMFWGTKEYHFNGRNRNLTCKPCTLIVYLLCSRQSHKMFRQCARWVGEGTLHFYPLTKGALQWLGVKFLLILK